MNEELDYSKLNGTKCYNAQGEDGKDAFEHICEQINKLQNNWNELKKCTKETIEELEKNRCILSVFDKGALVSLRVVYKKMQELEQGKDE